MAMVRNLLLASAGVLAIGAAVVAVRTLTYAPPSAVDLSKVALVAAPKIDINAAAAHLGGTAWLAWLPAWIRPSQSAVPTTPLAIGRHHGWIAAGLVAVLVCIFVLGPAVYLPGARPAD